MFSGILTATVVKTETGSLPEGKVKIKLEHDGTVLDVDEDDVEKVSCVGWLCPSQYAQIKDFNYSVKLKLNYFLDGSSVNIIVNVSLLSCFMFLSSFYYN